MTIRLALNVLYTGSDVDLVPLFKSLAISVGCSLAHAGTMAQARAIIRERPDDIALLLANRLPDGTGIALVKELRDRADLNHMPIALIINEDEDIPLGEIIAAGTDDCLKKPLTVGRIEDTLRRWSHVRASTPELEWGKLEREQAKLVRSGASMLIELTGCAKQGRGISQDVIKEQLLSLVTLGEDEAGLAALAKLRKLNGAVFVHSLRVACHLSYFAYYLQFNYEERNELFLGGLLHNIGALARPGVVRVDKRPLSCKEKAAIDRQAILATRSVMDTRKEAYPQNVINVCLLHKERIDGSGALGYQATEIPRVARMAAIVDEYVNLHWGADEGVGGEVSREEAVSVLMSSPGLDQGLVQTFVQDVIR